jgi:hypothetical protein
MSVCIFLSLRALPPLLPTPLLHVSRSKKKKDSSFAYSSTFNLPVTADQNGMMGTMMQDLAFAIPGVDEAMSFAEIMKYVVVSVF